MQHQQVFRAPIGDWPKLVVILHHPHRPFPHLRRKSVLRLAHLGFIYSEVGASGKPAALHTVANKFASARAVAYGSRMREDAFRQSSFAQQLADAAHMDQVAQALGVTATIRSTKVVGMRHMTKDEILSFAYLVEGESYNPLDLSYEISNLKRTGFFSDVNITDNDGNILIEVIENPVISKVIYEGHHLNLFKELKNELESSPNSVLSRRVVLSDVSFLTNNFRDLGILDINLVPKIIICGGDKVDLILEENKLKTSLLDNDNNIKYDKNLTFRSEDFVNVDPDYILKQAITTYVSEPLSLALRLVKIPDLDHDAFISDTIARILEYRRLEDLPSNDISTKASILPSPNDAPIKWKDREPGETPPDFVRRIYGQWAVEGEGISKRALRHLDSTLVTELNKWTREGNEMPSDLKILTVGEENRRMLDAGPEAIREHLGKFTGAEAVREARRLTMAKHRDR